MRKIDPCLENERRSLERSLSRLSSLQVELAFHRARDPLVRYRAFRSGRLELRMHEALADAPPEVLSSLVDWVLKRGDRGQRLDRHLDVLALRLRRASTPPPLLLRGEIHHLGEISSEVLERHFTPAKIDPRSPLCALPPRPASAVTWGPRRTASAKARKSILFGSYDPVHDLVRVHPRLDRADVPRRFVAFVVFHEFLHAAVPAQRSPSGRIVHHTPTFRRHERNHPDWEWAEAWERENIRRLASS
jgi:hypothetical protein